MKESLTWDRFEDIVIFRFHGVIQSDITGELRQKILRTLKDERVDTAIFHLGDAASIDSMGIGMFVHLHVQFRDRIRFVFCELTGSVSQAFGYVKLISFFDIRDSLEDALEELNRADH